MEAGGGDKGMDKGHKARRRKQQQGKARGWLRSPFHSSRFAPPSSPAPIFFRFRLFACRVPMRVPCPCPRVGCRPVS